MLWYEEEIQILETQRAELTYQPDTVFYGSSSIRQWTDLSESFKDLKPVNLGFGGSTLAACAWFFDRILTAYHPDRIVVYAGDNDLADGRHPQEVAISFDYLKARVAEKYGTIPCYFISIKPSIARWGLIDQISYTNELIAKSIKSNPTNWHWVDIFTPMLAEGRAPDPAFFITDGLHLSPKGYQIWTSVLKNAMDVTESEKRLYLH